MKQRFKVTKEELGNLLTGLGYTYINRLIPDSVELEGEPLQEQLKEETSGVCENWRYCQHRLCKDFDKSQHCSDCWHINNVYPTSRSYCNKLDCPCHQKREETPLHTTGGWTIRPSNKPQIEKLTLWSVNPTHDLQDKLNELIDAFNTRNQ